VVPAHPGSPRHSEEGCKTFVAAAAAAAAAAGKVPFLPPNQQIKTKITKSVKSKMKLIVQSTRNEVKLTIKKHLKLEIISTLLRQIGIPPPTTPPGESLCIKNGNQIGGWVLSRFDQVIRGGPKYTNF